MSEKSYNIIGVIPCRFASSRFPGKPLVDIDGYPMMWHVYQRSIESGVLDKVFIATDDERIFDSAKSHNLDVIMTSTEHETGTDRVAEVAEKITSNYYVNIQGDEPLIEPNAIKAVANGILESDDALVQASNAYSKLEDPANVIDTNVVKVVMDSHSNALAYSRSPIPYPKTGVTNYYRQLGLYAFKKSGLQIFQETSPCWLELTEGVEMFRLLEHGYRVKMIETDDKSISVDTKEDLKRLREAMKERKSDV